MQALVAHLIGEIAVPRPKILVFTTLEGWWLGDATEPISRRRIFGMSRQLFRRVDDELVVHTSRRLHDFAEIEEVAGREWASHLVDLPRDYTGSVDYLPDPGLPQHMSLRPLQVRTNP